MNRYELNKYELLNNIIEKSNISTEPINYIGRCEEQICEFYTYND